MKVKQYFEVMRANHKSFLIRSARDIERYNALTDREKLNWFADVVLRHNLSLMVDNLGTKRSMGLAVLLMKEAKVFYSRPLGVNPIRINHERKDEHRA